MVLLDDFFGLIAFLASFKASSASCNPFLTISDNFGDASKLFASDKTARVTPEVLIFLSLDFKTKGLDSIAQARAASNFGFPNLEVCGVSFPALVVRRSDLLLLELILLLDFFGAVCW